MKVTVWTKWNTREENPDMAKQKCIAIFDDYKDPLPTPGIHVQVRDGMGYESIDYVLLDMEKGCAEIHLQTADEHNNYGPGLI